MRRTATGNTIDLDRLVRTGPLPAGRRAGLLALLGLGLLAPACASVPPFEPEPAPEASPYRSANAQPGWLGAPLTWDKLDAVEAWLEKNRYAARKSLVAQADLELAEGRLAFARRAPGTDERALALRLAGAEDGFRRVLANPAADASLLRRAHQGLLEAQSVHPRAAREANDDPTIVRRASWGAKPAVGARLTRHLGTWNSLTVHHSAKDRGTELGGGSDAEVADALRRVQKVHMSDRGFGDIGYHFLIDPRGRVYEGRSMQWQGAHAYGANNVGNIGVCLLGNFNVESPTPRALAALERLIGDLARRYRIPKSRIYGHEELRATECPGDRLMAWLRRYRGGIGTAAHHPGQSTRATPAAARIR